MTSLRVFEELERHGWNLLEITHLVRVFTIETEEGPKVVIVNPNSVSILVTESSYEKDF